MAMNVNFKAEPNYTINYNNKKVTPMPQTTNIDDMFLLQAMEQQKVQKKEKSRERWNKAGVIAQIGLAASFATIAICTVISMKKGGAANSISKNTKLAWEDLSKNTKFPKIEDDCVNPKVRKFIETMKKRNNLSKEIQEYTGVQGAEQCILMYGPSGTGKTFSGQMLAKELGAEYTKVQFADVSSPFVGQTSVEIQNVFKQINETAIKNPNKKYVISFDEIDALLVPREKCGANNLHLAENRTAFLNGLDLIKDKANVKIIGTTNVHPESGNLDAASLSRFKNMIEIDLPTTKELKSALKFQLGENAPIKNHKFFENNDSKLETLVKELHNRKYSQRDVEDISKKAYEKFSLSLEGKSNFKDEKFSISYLEDAMKEKGITTGAISSYKTTTPAWEKIEAPTQQLSIAQKIKKFLGFAY